jgi:hypothetical protein
MMSGFVSQGGFKIRMFVVDHMQHELLFKVNCLSTSLL